MRDRSASIRIPGQPYRWLTDTPATLGPTELPLVTREQIFALIDELEQLDPATTARHRARGSRPEEARHHHRHTSRAAGRRGCAGQAAAKILAAAPHGKRHNTMVGATLALAMRGYSDAVIFDALDSAYYLVNDLSIEEASERSRTPSSWARERVGPDDATMTGIMAPALSSIASAWNKRWRRDEFARRL